MTRHGWLTAAGFALIWIVASVISAGTTFHLAPVIVAGSAPVVAPERRGREAIVATGLALVVVVGLLAAGRLDGPSLLPWGDADLESALGAVAGGVLGFLVAGLIGSSGEPSGG